MTRFAYPNVLNEEFIGCGRYEATAKRVQQSRAAPDAPNLDETLAAAENLVPEVTASKAQVYEVRDYKNKLYRGPSLTFAYLLASIHRARSLKPLLQEFSKDIWCTGEVRFSSNSPELRFLGIEDAFDAKLQEFRNNENRDTLFFVPAANLLSQDLSELGKGNNHLASVEVLDLPAFHASLRRNSLTLTTEKVVVTIRPHELPQLVDVLFESPQDRDITQWFWALTRLRRKRQISCDRYRLVLMYAVQRRLNGFETRNELLRMLHDLPRDELKQRLYFEGAASKAEIRKTIMRPRTSDENSEQWEAPPLIVQQVLVALRYGLPLCQTILDIPFVLIPPGTTQAGLVNDEAVYLAKAPVDEAAWVRIMKGDAPDWIPNDKDPRINLCIYEILQFCKKANDRLRQLGRHTTFVIPGLEQWLFAFTEDTETLGLEDVHGKVAQCCRVGGSINSSQYAVHGGRYSNWTPCPTTDHHVDALGFRPMLLLGREPRKYN